MDELEYLIAIGLIAFVIYCFYRAVKAAGRNKRGGNNRPPLAARAPTYDESPEEAEVRRKIEAYVGHTPITQSDVQAYTIHITGTDFQAMPEWDVWDESIHKAPGQYERMKRAVEQKLKVEAYDPKYRLARVVGSTGEMYLTSANRCSCEDFRKRGLPCKHMYALNIELDGDINREICNDDNRPLLGLLFSLAGRFEYGRDSEKGIRKRLNEKGGMWNDSISPIASALIVGKGASTGKTDIAQSRNMEILTPDVVLDLFIRREVNINDSARMEHEEVS